MVDGRLAAKAPDIFGCMAAIDAPRTWILRLFKREEREGGGNGCRWSEEGWTVGGGRPWPFRNGGHPVPKGVPLAEAAQ